MIEKLAATGATAETPAAIGFVGSFSGLRSSAVRLRDLMDPGEEFGREIRESALLLGATAGSLAGTVGTALLALRLLNAG
ncbi:MAG: hypothetical protein WDA71_05405 [Actinomycetota bacterium]